MSIGQFQCPAPGVLPGFPIDLDRKGFEVCKRSIACGFVDTASPDAYVQDVGDLNPPQFRDDGSVVGNELEDFQNCTRSLIWKDPRECGGAIEDKTHRRPSS